MQQMVNGRIRNLQTRGKGYWTIYMKEWEILKVKCKSRNGLTNIKIDKTTLIDGHSERERPCQELHGWGKIRKKVCCDQEVVYGKE